LFETTPHGVEVMKTLRQLGNDLLWLLHKCFPHILLLLLSFDLTVYFDCESNYNNKRLNFRRSLFIDNLSRLLQRSNIVVSFSSLNYLVTFLII
jgi:hypothetical protein